MTWDEDFEGRQVWLGNSYELRVWPQVWPAKDLGNGWQWAWQYGAEYGGKTGFALTQEEAQRACENSVREYLVKLLAEIDQ
jgi:hypothetical protein